ncbi:hypothetical protein K490DRAFT_61077 [Saccharata proteae CBS 121410]|uniref:Uncharacterized protein n=1 Tax=Saccharata proteae CBS 121410 TaxID=1314787 RepID=A0A9P4M397_9PEZI|nr:hypothetical protein K490DRAFT_61077 [Saccharata proteae CBS 121410]
MSPTSSTSASGPKPMRKPSDFPLPRPPRKHKAKHREDTNKLRKFAILKNITNENDHLREINAGRLDELHVPQSEQDNVLEILLLREEKKSLAKVNKRLTSANTAFVDETKRLNKKVEELKLFNKRLSNWIDGRAPDAETSIISPTIKSAPSTKSGDGHGFEMTEGLDGAQKATGKTGEGELSASDIAKKTEEPAKYRGIDITLESLKKGIDFWNEEVQDSFNATGQGESSKEEEGDIDWKAWDDNSGNLKVLREKEEEIETGRATHAAIQAAWAKEKEQLQAALANKDKEISRLNHMSDD